MGENRTLQIPVIEIRSVLQHAFRPFVDKLGAGARSCTYTKVASWDTAVSGSKVRATSGT